MPLLKVNLLSLSKIDWLTKTSSKMQKSPDTHPSGLFQLRAFNALTSYSAAHWPLHSLSEHTAYAPGMQVMKPRDVAKSVTVKLSGIGGLCH